MTGWLGLLSCHWLVHGNRQTSLFPIFLWVYPPLLPSWDSIPRTQFTDSAVRTFVPAMAGGKDKTQRWIAKTRLYKRSHAYLGDIHFWNSVSSMDNFFRNLLNVDLDWVVLQESWLLWRNIQPATLLHPSTCLDAGYDEIGGCRMEEGGGGRVCWELWVRVPVDKL